MEMLQFKQIDSNTQDVTGNSTDKSLEEHPQTEVIILDPPPQESSVDKSLHADVLQWHILQKVQLQQQVKHKVTYVDDYGDKLTRCATWNKKRTTRFACQASNDV